MSDEFDPDYPKDAPTPATEAEKALRRKIDTLMHPDGSGLLGQRRDYVQQLVTDALAAAEARVVEARLEAAEQCRGRISAQISAEPEAFRIITRYIEELRAALQRGRR